MKLSITACLLGAFSSLTSGYSIDICSTSCSSRACCTTITGPNDQAWRDFPAGYRGRLRHRLLRLGRDGHAILPARRLGKPDEPRRSADHGNLRVDEV
ncbi:hypothetical protein PG985_001506 [Apiospora marii]|uniref:uncharacterized protein n=1 Tax=Apiospora marii TaxID=335849 RepID=UPI00312F9120